MKLKDIIIIIGISLLLLFILKIFIVKNNSKETPNAVNGELVETLEYTEDSLHVIRKRIKYGQYLSSILKSYTISNYSVPEIIDKTSEVFDLKKIKAGNYYKAYLTRDSLRELKVLIYEHTMLEYVRISLVDSLLVEKLDRKIDTVQKSASGEIIFSLWQTMVDNNINPNLALELSEIYAWSIDFFGLQQGDKFKVIYDELFVDSNSIGIGKIYVASFIHSGVEYQGFLYHQNDKPGYYDEHGKSLKKAFLKSPLKFSRISSKYTNRRFHPILKIWRPHRGVDYAAPKGTPIYSIGDGKVIAKGYTKSAGYYIKIKHNGTYTSGYNHLSRYGKGMKKGVQVSQGQVIGYVGSTGYSTGPHLDFRIWKNGHLTNPLNIKAPPVEPVKKENLADFNKVKKLLSKLLDLV